MAISMQGNWTVKVRSKEAAYAQQFVISGATSGNGIYPGTVGTSVNVTGKQWSIAIQNNPGTGFQLSDTKIKFPHKVGTNYEFEIWSNDAWIGDKDYNDLILVCSTPVNINDFIIYGNASLYAGHCWFNPCWKGPFVIDTYESLIEVLKNSKLRDEIGRLYPERIPHLPDPPDPGPFKPIVIDLDKEIMQPKIALVYKRIQNADTKSGAKLKTEELTSEFSVSNYTFLKSVQKKPVLADIISSQTELAGIIDELVYAQLCSVKPASNITLSFEEYDRTAGEKAGGAYTGTGNRQLLGDSITDAYGNYIFRFTFDMTFPYIADSTDIAGGEDINVVAYPDVIVKVISFSPYKVLYESAPYYNISNLRRIDLCLPKSSVPPSSTCFNGNLIGSLGNVFLGGDQNSGASFLPDKLKRYGYSNFLEADGKISVGSSLAGFNIECAAWSGIIDMKGCMYDFARTAAENKIKWYTIRIMRDGTNQWAFVSQNYKHPKYSKRNLPNYIGDDVGPFPASLKVDGGPAQNVPAYKNIQREIFVDGVDWEFSGLDRYMQLNTSLYDVKDGVIAPDTFYVRIDGYDAAGNVVPDATDMIALFIHNKPLNFQLSSPSFTDTSIVTAGCNLYRLTNAQLNAEMQLKFMANDPYGFVHSYDLAMSRCPVPMIALKVNSPNPPLSDTLSGANSLSKGDASGNIHNSCNGYSGTLKDFSDAGLINVKFQPSASEGGWIKSGEYFTILAFSLTAYKRVTNGYNTGITDWCCNNGRCYASASIYLERFTP